MLLAIAWRVVGANEILVDDVQSRDQISFRAAATCWPLSPIQYLRRHRLFQFALEKRYFVEWLFSPCRSTALSAACLRISFLSELELHFDERRRISGIFRRKALAGDQGVARTHQNLSAASCLCGARIFTCEFALRSPYVLHRNMPSLGNLNFQITVFTSITL